jgi:hypothetical protein
MKMDFKRTAKLGIRDGLETTWELTKVIVPVYFIITFLKYTPVIDWVADVFQPLTLLIGLPGEATLPIVIGNALSTYPAIHAITSFSFTSKEITIISTVILICHSLPIETAIAKKSGAKGRSIIAIRIAAAVLAGMILNFILGG